MTRPAPAHQSDALRSLPVTPAERRAGRLIVRDYPGEGIQRQEYGVIETTEVLSLDVTRRIYEEVVIHTHALDREATIVDVLRREEVEITVEDHNTSKPTQQSRAATTLDQTTMS